MSDCCTSTCHDKPKSTKLGCPDCGQKSLNVITKTILHHVKQPWLYDFHNQQYYFCRNPGCDVAYFSESDESIYKSEIRTRIGIKEQSDDALICFCFGVTNIEAVTNKKIKDFVIAQTKESNCTCDTSNPSGQCCLKDFPKSK